MRLAQLLLALSTAHAVVVTPIGPFCPFRSQACALGGNLDGDFQQLTAASPQFVTEMSRMQLDMQMGKEPDRGKMAELAKQLDASHRQWETLLAKMRLSPDFQSGEYFKMTSAHMEEQGQSLDELGLMVRWQCDSMAAFAEGKMPPMPPPGIDLMKLQQQAESGAGQQAAMSSMLSPPSVTAMPFDAALFESDVVRAEYEKLSRDHAALITMGEGFGSFDPLGKCAYVDAVEAIEERWDVFYGRATLMGSISSEFKAQTDAYLQAINLDVDGFRALLKKAHDKIRADAEAERLG